MTRTKRPLVPVNEEDMDTVPNDPDSDESGITDDELVIGTNPNDSYSDDDRITYGDEVYQVTDPTNDRKIEI